jgi:hypothetical protein
MRLSWAGGNRGRVLTRAGSSPAKRNVTWTLQEYFVDFKIIFTSNDQNNWDNIEKSYSRTISASGISPPRSVPESPLLPSQEFSKISLAL